MRRHVAPRSFSVSSLGFTLLELIVALALFSLILGFVYQVLVTSVDVHDRVSDSISSQERVRIAHRTLSDALASGGRFSGESRLLEIDLGSAITQWSLSAQLVRFEIRNGNELWQFMDKQTNGEMLLREPINLRFGYLDETNQVYLSWEEGKNPQAVSLGQVLSGETTARQPTNPKWLFLTQ